jgi:2-polyprenyl-6-methoxyphenol hydroxylase-like FAD-dependent oxidoreductase
MASTQCIAIIGAGLSGLSLALALHQQGIPCTLFESRPAPLDIGGAIMLSPNALKILDRIGVYEPMKPVSFEFENSYFRSADNQLVDGFEFGSTTKYGYPGLRVYRHELIRILLDKVRESGVPVEFGKKFDRIVAETEEAVTWAFADGSEASARLLIGTDGIHSRVRQYLHPDANMQPKFTNMCGVTAAVPTKQLAIPDDADYQMPVTIMNPKHGAFVIAPQLPDGSEVLIGKQYKFSGPEPDRQGWDKLHADKAWCIDFLRQNSEEFPNLVGNAVSEIDTKKINLWPFYLLPKLDSWTSASKHSRVVILGDAAHAIPPSAGQGINQAFEDVYTFAGVLGRLTNNADSSAATLQRSLSRWQEGRQSRINQVIELNDQINKRRLPSQGEEIDLSPFNLEWLYSADFDRMIAEFTEEN